MKGKRLVLASALVMGFLSLSAVAATSTTLYGISHVKQNDNLNMRAGAGISNDVVTTIPFDGAGIQLLGDEVLVGKTRWVLIKWKGVTGWVSKYYLAAESAQEKELQQKDEVLSESKPEEIVEKETSKKQASNEKKSSEKKIANSDVIKLKKASLSSNSAEESNGSTTEQSPVKQDTWVLQCGNKMPYWKVELHPKWMNIVKGEYETGLPITKKKQERNRWNTALKTIVHGRNGPNNLKMTIKYAYSKRCYDTLSGLRVPYKVTTEFNGEELTGCCRAVKLEAPNGEETKLSMK